MIVATRYGVTAWYGSGLSYFYVVDGSAPDGEQPAIVATFTDRESADIKAAELNSEGHEEEEEAELVLDAIGRAVALWRGRAPHSDPVAALALVREIIALEVGDEECPKGIVALEREEAGTR